MRNLRSFKIITLLSVAVGSVAAYHDECGPLDRGSWFVMPLVGVAPTIFTGRGHEQRVTPLGGDATDQRAITCGTFGPQVQNANQFNVLQQDQCKIPKFGDVFTNGVLHVGFQVGHNVCDNTQVYLEFVYNRASGSCLETSTRNFAAPDGCASNDCASTGTQLSSSSRTIDFDNYSAYGGYIASRHYWNKQFFCDRMSLWGGFKVGILHRKKVDGCINIPAVTTQVVTATNSAYTFAARNNIGATIFCDSNSVSGGITFGADYCVSDCFSLLIGVEVIASCGLKSNRNLRLPLADNPTPVVETATDIPSGAFPQPTNIILGETGTLLQFPVYAGFQWNWGWCNDACEPC